MRAISSVAVVIACHNQGRFLSDSLASVRAQTFPAIECVIVDDGSTDAETLAILEQLRRGGQRVLQQENRGLAAARNAGIRATQGPFFVPLDADDRLATDFVATLLPLIQKAEDLGYVYSHVRLFGATEGIWRCPQYDPDRLLIQNLSVATALVRREAFEKVGGYRMDMTAGFEDWDFWLKLLDAAYIGYCEPRVLFHYRRHAGGSMLDQAQARRMELVRALIRNHRALFAGRFGVQENDVLLEAAWLAQQELYAIRDSRAWRFARFLAGDPLRRSTGQAPGDVSRRVSPIEQLAQLKAGAAYRLTQVLKGTYPYKWYARRKYGDDILQMKGK